MECEMKGYTGLANNLVTFSNFREYFPYPRSCKSLSNRFNKRTK